MPVHRKPRVPKQGFTSWPTLQHTYKVEEVVQMYDKGFAGCIYSEAEREETLDSMPEPDGEKVAADNGFMGAGEGKLTMLWQYSQEHYKVWPKPGQETGNCVGCAGANIGIILIGIDVISKMADELTKKIEDWPELTPLAIKNGVVAFEPIYGDRGHAGQGASCDRLIRHVTDWGGIVLRKNYSDIGLNLEEVDTNLSIRWGRSQTPEAVRKLGQEHQVRHATTVNGWENGRDFIARGCPLWSCSGLGWSNKRDENGYSKQSGSWGHSWVVDGFDDRKEIVEKYGFPLFHYNHDWGKWNSGGRRVYGTAVDIPEGSFWADARLLNKCDLWAMNSISGWPQRNLPPFYVPGVFR